MKDETLKRVQLLIENRDRIKEVFSWDSGVILLASAAIFTMKDQLVDIDRLIECKNSLKSKTGIFSSFRNTARTPIVCMAAASENPEESLVKGLKVYELLRNEFFTSAYLPVAAMIIAELSTEEEFETIASRTRTIYNCMKKEHPWLTSSEDSTFCALMALSDKSDQVLMRDAEECYSILKPQFFSANAIQSLSHVLALLDGSPNEKCQRTMDLFNKLRDKQYRYGTGYELPTLGILAMSDGVMDDIVAEMIEIDEWLSNQKGFGFFGSISGKQRLMYAGIIAEKNYVQAETMQTAVVNGTISVIVAQEAAMCAAIAASSSAAAANSSN